jgi:hypothetical protein
MVNRAIADAFTQLAMLMLSDSTTTQKGDLE